MTEYHVVNSLLARHLSLCLAYVRSLVLNRDELEESALLDFVIGKPPSYMLAWFRALEEHSQPSSQRSGHFSLGRLRR
jgi:hypothetical protein